MVAVEEARVDVHEMRKRAAIERAQLALAQQHLHRVVRGTDDVVGEVARLQLGEQRLVRVVEVDVHAHAVAALEFLQRLGRDVARPDVQVQHLVAGGGPGCEQERRPEQQQRERAPGAGLAGLGAALDAMRREQQ